MARDLFNEMVPGGAFDGSPRDLFAESMGQAPATPPQYQGAMRLPAIAGSEAATGAAESLGLPGSLANLFMRYGYYPAGRMMTGNSPDFGKTTPGQDQFLKYLKMALPTANDMHHTMTDLGVADRSDLEPQSTLERYVGAGAHGVGSTIPGLMAGGFAGAMTPELAASSLTRGLGAGMGGELAAQNYSPDLPGADYAPLVGSLLGGRLGGRFGDATSRLANINTGSPTPAWTSVGGTGSPPSMAHTIRNFMADADRGGMLGAGAGWLFGSPELGAGLGAGVGALAPYAPYAANMIRRGAQKIPAWNMYQSASGTPPTWASFLYGTAPEAYDQLPP